MRRDPAARSTTARSTTVRGAISGATAALLLALLPLADASAAPPRAVVLPCGAVLTHSVRLAADVVCPAGGVGVTLAADGVELNLNGHAVSGPGAGPATAEGIGVLVQAEDAVIRNGGVTGWASGVRAGVDDDLARSTRATSSATVRGVRVADNSIGVHALDDGSLTVAGSWLVGNWLGGYAYHRGRLVVEGSTADRNDTGLFAYGTDRGALVIRASTVRRSREVGVGCGQHGEVVLESSTVQRNPVGLDLDACSARITGSAFVWNTTHAVVVLDFGDDLSAACTSSTRDGGPLPFPVRACGPGSTSPDPHLG